MVCAGRFKKNLSLTEMALGDSWTRLRAVSSSVLASCDFARIPRFKTPLAFLVITTLLLGCAIPQSHSAFSIASTSESGERVEFASTDDLMVSGLVTEALSYAKASRFYDAEIRLRQALYLKPTNEAVAYNTAVVISQSGQTQEAREIIERLIQRHPTNPNYKVALAEMFRQENKPSEAIETLKELLWTLKRHNNIPRAAGIARSISNIAFGMGNESEALCYSYEALSLSPSPPEVAAHARVLLGLNYYRLVEEFVTSQPNSMHSALSYHYLALARYALGSYDKALEAEQIAVTRGLESPDRLSEFNSAWWLMKAKAPSQKEESEEVRERYQQMRNEVYEFAEKQPYELVVWPAALRAELQAVPPKPEK